MSRRGPEVWRLFGDPPMRQYSQTKVCSKQWTYGPHTRSKRYKQKNTQKLTTLYLVERM